MIAEALMEMKRQRNEARAAYGDCIETQKLSVARERVLREALEMILANTEQSAIKHMGHDGLTAYEALAKAVADCARAALSARKEGE